MDLRQLETFLWVVRLGSFSAAALHLNTSQPAVSKRIRQLEESLGVRLFQGNTRNTRATAQGRELVDYAVQAVALMTTIRQRIGRRDAITGVVRLGASDIVALTWLPALVARLREVYPRLKIELLIDLTINLRARLDRHDLDVAFLYGPVPGTHLVRRPIGSLPMSWMASPRLALPEGRLTPADLARVPVLSHTQGSDHYNVVLAWFHDREVQPPPIHCCNSLATLIRLAVAGVGASVMPEGLMRPEIEAGELRAVATDPPFPPHPFEAVFPSDSPQPLAAEIVALGLACAAADPVFQAGLAAAPLPHARAG